MSGAYHDLRLLHDTIDGLLVGWVNIPPEPRSWAQTATGIKTEQLLKKLWTKFYVTSNENIQLKARLEEIKLDNDGLRAANEQLTNELDYGTNRHTNR